MYNRRMEEMESEVDQQLELTEMKARQEVALQVFSPHKNNTSGARPSDKRERRNAPKNVG